MTISLVMAVHNGRKYIANQLSSVLNGTEQPNEWVIVDDASTDGSLSLVQDILTHAQVRNVKYLSNPKNVGPTRAFIKGTMESTGDIVLFCDQDDVWHPEKISLIKGRYLSDRELLLVYHDGELVDETGQSLGKSIWSTRKNTDLSDPTHRSLREVANNPDIKGCTMAVQGQFVRALFRATPDTIEKYWGHDHWAALMAWSPEHVDQIPKKLIDHRIHVHNTSGNIRFSASSISAWRRRLKLMRTQDEDHFLMRYALAIEVLQRVYPNSHSALLEALLYHYSVSETRVRSKRRNLVIRLQNYIKLYRSGYYQRYGNGGWTLLRDILT